MSKLRSLIDEARRALKRQSKTEYYEALKRQLGRLIVAERAARDEAQRWRRAPASDEREAYQNAKRAADAKAAAESFAARVQRKGEAMMRAKRAAGLLVVGVFAGHMGCASAQLGEALEVATVATAAALERCRAQHAGIEGDASEAARSTRSACLGAGTLGPNADAAEALADELEAARLWVDTGSTRLLH